MKATLRIPDAGDIFEILIRGQPIIIARITCYVGGSQRLDVQFDDLPQRVKDEIVKQINQFIEED